MKFIIVYGPQGCGKTFNSEVIKRNFNAKEVIDGHLFRGKIRADKVLSNSNDDLIVLLVPMTINQIPDKVRYVDIFNSIHYQNIESENVFNFYNIPGVEIKD